ncbi:hypothetical protein VC87395_000288, partial [Vibrio paracholerae 87395]
MFPSPFRGGLGWGSSMRAKGGGARRLP